MCHCVFFCYFQRQTGSAVSDEDATDTTEDADEDYDDDDDLDEFVDDDLSEGEIFVESLDCLNIGFFFQHNQKTKTTKKKKDTWTWAQRGRTSAVRQKNK